MKENVTQVNGGKMINVEVSVKNVMHDKKIIYGTMLHAAEKMENV